MAKKPTYRELEQRIRELEKESAGRKAGERGALEERSQDQGNT